MTFISSGISFLCSAARQVTQAIVSVAVNTAIEAGFQDQRIGKIVGGVFLTFAGIGVTIGSGVPKRLKARFITKKEMDRAEGTRETALRYATAALGLATTCYGIYNVVMGIVEFIPCSEGPLKSAKEELLSCPEFRKLWNEVEAEGPFTLCSTVEGHDARTEIKQRQIFVGRHVTYLRDYSLVFELNNLKRSKEFFLIKAQECRMSVDEYATSIEKIEYDSLIEAGNIANACQKRGIWQGWYPSFLYTSFEEYLRSAEMFDHTDLYRVQYRYDCNCL